MKTYLVALFIISVAVASTTYEINGDERNVNETAVQIGDTLEISFKMDHVCDDTDG